MNLSRLLLDLFVPVAKNALARCWSESCRSVQSAFRFLEVEGAQIVRPHRDPSPPFLHIAATSLTLGILGTCLKWRIENFPISSIFRQLEIPIMQVVARNGALLEGTGACIDDAQGHLNAERKSQLAKRLRYHNTTENYAKNTATTTQQTLRKNKLKIRR